MFVIRHKDIYLFAVENVVVTIVKLAVNGT